MQAEIQRLDHGFKRFFLWFNLGWILVSLISFLFSAIAAFSNHPEYLHSWQGLVITILGLYIPGAFGLLLLSTQGKNLRQETRWPPAVFFVICFWGSLYLITTILNLFDNDFVWSYFTVLGITYSFMHYKWAIIPMIIIFLSYSYFLGFFTWPLLDSNWPAVLGNGITFLSLTIICLSIQYLISERHERRRLHLRLTQMNDELEIAHSQLAASATQEQELAVLRERTRLAREMHDTLGHALVLVSVKLEAAQRLRAFDPQRCDQELELTKEIVRSSMKELRASIANLRSPALEHESASRALSRYAGEMALRADICVTYDLHPQIEDLPATIAETLWKVGIEALTNIEKHARAHNVLLHISRQNEQIFLKIKDDGIGLPAHLCEEQPGYTPGSQSLAGHYGLRGMLERVKNAQGELRVHAADAQGTSIEVTLPLPKTLPLLLPITPALQESIAE
ncbi:MAG TPA: sensor histidine kinase [Ktedonobacteraceae bacterium]